MAGVVGTEADELNKHGSIMTNPDQPESSIAVHQENETQEDDVDWSKVGNLYNKETPLSAVMDREFARLNKALETKLTIQDEKLM